MFCGICGAKADEGDKFCIKCGARLTQEINTEAVQMPVYEMPEPSKYEEQVNTNDNASQVQKPKKSNKKLFIIIGAIALFAIIICISFVFIIKAFINKKVTEAKTIDIEMEYLDIDEYFQMKEVFFFLKFENLLLEYLFPLQFFQYNNLHDNSHSF